jgi:serine/threonine protein kinase
MLPSDRALVRRKRAYLKQLAREIRGMHEEGFVHGDLIPSNILVQSEGEEIAFYYLDHDRTRRYPPWFPQRLWKRNLVQLNRFVLAGISLQDRIRFLKYYLNGRPWGRRERQLALWLEAKTRKRRRECDQVEARVSFRELMRWNGPFARNRPQAGR